MGIQLQRKINTQLARKLPFVVYRRPLERRVTALFQKDAQLHYLKNYEDTGFVMAPFAPGNPSVLIIPDSILRTEYESDRGNTRAPEIPQRAKIGRDSYLRLVEKGLLGIGRGDFKKVVLSRKFDVPTGTNTTELLKKLLSNFPNAFCYLWYHPKVGLWMGASPEVLLMLEGRNFRTMSLAGTRKRSGDDTINWGAKERDEQHLVTQYLLEILENKAEQIQLSKTKAVNAGGVVHLQTKITGKTKVDGPGNLINALHPTPAVCGLPKAPALEFILANEGYDRNYYTGYLGEINMPGHEQEGSEKSSCLYVNLRCMQLKDSMATLYVGGGITRGSCPEQEWQETLDKSTTMLRLLDYSED